MCLFYFGSSCSGQFVMEYVGEVLDFREFKNRTKQYAKMNIVHHYFMALTADEVIDATMKGNISRFINHSCDPNCETQKVLFLFDPVQIIVIVLKLKSLKR